MKNSTTKKFESVRAPAAVINALKEARSVLISGHVRPDGDSLGSMLALMLALRKQGKRAYAVVQSRRGLGAPGFLTGVETLLTPAEAAKKKFDLFVSIDCADSSRLSDEIREIAEKIGYGVSIDHHYTNTCFAKINWIRGSASSAGEMIWRLIKDAKWEYGRDIAEAIWVALITDTGRFAYDMTTVSTLQCGADLVAHGVRTSYINDKIYCSVSKTAIELKKRAFRNLRIEGNVAYVYLSGRDFAETKGNKADVEDVIDIPRSILGNRVAVFFYGAEDNPNETWVSIRTREGLDASSIAAVFGGGGHHKAAGCNIQLPLHQAIKEFMRELKNFQKRCK